MMENFLQETVPYRERILRKARTVKAMYFLLLATVSVMSVTGFVLVFLFANIII